MKIFLSSTFRDLVEERTKFHTSLKKAGFESLGMEFFVAEPKTPKEVCLAEVAKADLVLLTVTDNYGTIDTDSGKSFTHLEFDKAREGQKEILGFLQKNAKDENVQSFQKQIQESGITVDYFDDKSDLPWVLWPALLRFIQNKGFPSKTRTFNDFTQFYARAFQKDSIFNYNQKLIGRTEELEKLAAFLSDGTQKIAIVMAAGGIGKSKLIYEFAQDKLNNSNWNFRFVPYQVDFDNDSIRELPAQKTCIIIEDAHKQKKLDNLMHSLLNNFPYDIKIIITTRHSGLKSIQETFRDDNPIIPIDLPALSKEDSIKLAKSILKDENQKWAEAICRHASGNTLVIVMTSELIQSKQLDGTLIQDDTFREKVLEKMLVELEKIDNPKNIHLGQLLATIASLSPLIEDDVIEPFSESFNVEKHDMKSILDYLQKYGFIIKIGNRLRVVPDILSDYILLKHSTDSHNKPTGFVDSLFKKYGGNYLKNLLINLSEIEYSTNTRDLTSCIWDSIYKEIEMCSIETYYSILKLIEPVAYLVPDKVYGILSKILNGKVDCDKNSNEYEIRQVANSVIAILSNLGKRHKFTKRACLGLWKISTPQKSFNFPDRFSESPTSSLKKLISFDDNNTFGIQKEAMNAVREIIIADKHVGRESELCEIIESALKPEVENHSYNRRTFSWGWFCIYEIADDNIKQQVISARNGAFDLYSLLIDKAGDSALLGIGGNLIQKLKTPNLRSREISDEIRVEFEREAEIAESLLKKIIGKNIPVLNNCIYELLISREERLLANININKIASASIKSDYNIFSCIRHDWPEYCNDDIDTRDKRFQRKQELTANKLWEKCNSEPASLLNYIQQYRETLKQYRIAFGDYAFLRACASVRPKLCLKTIDIIIAQNKDDYFARTISTWLQFSPQEQQHDLSRKILENGNACHKKSIAQSLSQLRGLTENELVILIEDLSKDSNQEVVDATIRNLGVVCYHRKIETELQRVVSVICNYDTQDNSDKLEILLDNFNPHWVSPDRLQEDQASLLLEKIKHVKKLTDQHDTGAFLSHIIIKRPLECVRLFLWRVQNINSEDTQPFPYNEGFHDKPKNLISNAEYPQCIVEILDAMKTYDWRTYFWCPTIVYWLDNEFSDATKKILLENINRHENALRAITNIFVGYERDFFFTNIDFVNQLLVQISQLTDEDIKGSLLGKLIFMPFSGARCMSGLGEHDDISLSVIGKCEKLLTDNPNYPEFTKKIYRDLIEYANNEDKRKLDSDKVELQEEEF